MKAKNVGKRIAGFLYKEKAIAAILAVVIVMIFVNPVFFSAYNLTDILKSATVLVTIGCGLTPVIICHGCDLSLGGQMCLASILMVKLMPYIPIWLCAVVCILIGCFIGALNGFLVVHQKTEPFVITLGVGILLKGINQLLTDAHPIAGTSD